MKSQKKQVESMLRELYDMHEELFGVKYIPGGNITEESQFNKIIEEFRELIFNIRHTQQERQLKEKKKNYTQSPASIEINFILRQDLSRAQVILAEALKRLETQKRKLKKQVKKYKEKQGQKESKLSDKQRLAFQLLTKKQSILQNCFELLNDVKQTEQGGVYHPPKSYKTLQQIKKELIGKQYEAVDEDSINLEEEQFFQQANKNDQIMDSQLDEIIQGNQRIKNKMISANQSMDKIHEKVVKVTKKTEMLNQRVRKDQKDLIEILKTYRRPNQLCLDITLVLLVLALIGVIINLIRTL